MRNKPINLYLPFPRMYNNYARKHVPRIKNHINFLNPSSKNHERKYSSRNNRN